MQACLAVDIGGTFTDVALHANGQTYITKVLTTHDAPEQGFMLGMENALAEAALPASALTLIVHGTTLATNAIIERRGARTAILTNKGFRDVLEIADEGRFDQYDLMITKNEPLTPRHLRFVVRGRLDVTGAEIAPLDEGDVREAARQMREMDVASIAVCFLHAFRNSAHERRAQAILAEEMPGAPISISSEVCPEVREYERFSTTCANAYVRPLMDKYLSRLGEGLKAKGAACPLLLMTSGGGLASLDTARRLPIRLVESGPAGGAILSSEIARELGVSRALSFDMGGTTAKICLIENSRPEMARTFEVARAARFMKGSGLPLRIPVIEMIEIGAGGGSIAHVDQLGGVKVGPQSAESEPGPACYQRGGQDPTVTDADLVLGRLDGARFAGGAFTLSKDAAAGALERVVGTPQGMSAAEAAFAVCETIDETMANAARVYAVERGKDLSDHVMIAFGGAAPLHAARVAEKLRVRQVIIPRNAGVGSALGFMCAPIAYETVRSHHMLLSRFDAAAINAVLAALLEEARYAIRDVPGVNLTSCTTACHAYMRYLGQGHEVLTPLPARQFTDADGPLIIQHFEERYRELFKRTLPASEVELLTLSLRLEAPNNLRLSEVNSATPRATQDAAGSRRVFLPNLAEFASVEVATRDFVRDDIKGPCIIAEPTTTTFVTSAFDASLAKGGHLVLTRKVSQESPHVDA